MQDNALNFFLSTVKVYEDFLTSTCGISPAQIDATSKRDKPTSGSTERILKMYIVITSLFAKLSRPGDSEETLIVFESSCHLLTSPAYHTPRRLHTILVIAEPGVDPEIFEGEGSAKNIIFFKTFLYEFSFQFNSFSCNH